MLRGKSIIVPGVVNKLLRLIAPFVPLSLVTGAIRHLWGGFAEEIRDAVPERA